MRVALSCLPNLLPSINRLVRSHASFSLAVVVAPTPQGAQWCCCAWVPQQPVCAPSPGLFHPMALGW